MKKLASILCAAGLLFSCTQLPDRVETPPVRTVSFRATGEPATRTSLQGNAVFWTEGDRASVFSAESAAPFSASDIEGASCTFTGLLSGEEGPVYALYPYSAEAICNQGVITAVLPTVQRAVAGGFDPAAALAVAAAGRVGDPMMFRNGGALVRFSLSAETAATSSP